METSGWITEEQFLRAERKEWNRIQHKAKRNVRFWQWLNDGFVRITLEPGQSITHYTGGPTDEGHHYTTETFQYDAEEGVVRRERSDDSCDCDGPFHSWGECFSPLSDLAGFEPGYSHEEKPATDHLGAEIRTPLWTEGESGQRDVYAESMGY